MRRLVLGMVCGFLFCGCGNESAQNEIDLGTDKTWSECSAWLTEKGVDLTADDYTWYADMCRWVRRYTHDKLTVPEIMVVMDKLTDLMSKGTVMEYKIFMVRVEDRVRASVRLLEMIPETKGKLNYGEKEAIVACALWVCSIPGSGMDVNEAFAKFKDFDEFNGVYKKMKEDYPTLFRRHDPGTEGRFGYDITNPIRAVSVSDGYRYLHRLMPENDSVKFEWNRIGSMRGHDSNIVDGYKFSCEDVVARTNYTFTIYIDPYSEETSKEAFEGWHLKDSKATE